MICCKIWVEKLFDKSHQESLADVVGYGFMKTFVMYLKKIRLEDCRQLQEILELPPNIEEVYANGCISSERFPEVSRKFQLNTCNLRALRWIELFKCYKMSMNIRIHVANPLFDEGHLNDYFGGIIFPGSMTPDWLIHCKEASNTRSCEIDIDGLLYWGEIIGIAVYAAVRPIFAISTETPLHLLNVDITCNGVRKLCKERILHSRGLDHEWLEYSLLEPFQLKGKSLNVKFTYYSNSLSLKRCGV
ncbi:hypothetical protein I3843_15G138000 [Carya illinoinensis]|nr:hypothetical protein I3843_15G138000 [Carya illinoinensis]